MGSLFSAHSAADITDRLPSMGNTPETQSNSHRHYRQLYHEVKYISSGDNGETFAAIKKTDADKIAARHQHLKTEAYFDELRYHLVAVKLCKDYFIENDLEQEIIFLTHSLKVRHPCFTSCLNVCLDDKQGIQWLALSFISGGDLSDFVDDMPHALSLSFRWHVASQLCEALLVLLYGVTTPSAQMPAMGWPLVAHGDIFLGNLLLRPNGSFGVFPDIVIADFGRAAEYRENDEEYLRAQVHDIHCIAMVLDNLKESSVRDGHYCDCGPCVDGEVIMEDCIRRLNTFGPLIDCADCIAVLKELKAVADAQRVLHYCGMPTDALAELHRCKISNEELETAIESVHV